MEPIFNPCGEFGWSSVGPVCQIHSPHLRTEGPGIFLDLLKSVQMLKREWGVESNGKLPHLRIPSNTAALVPAVEDMPFAELQPWFLRLLWNTCPWAEHSDNDDDDDDCQNFMIEILYILLSAYLSLSLSVIYPPQCRTYTSRNL